MVICEVFLGVRIHKSKAFFLHVIRKVICKLWPILASDQLQMGRRKTYNSHRSPGIAQRYENNFDDCHDVHIGVDKILVNACIMVIFNLLLCKILSYIIYILFCPFICFVDDLPSAPNLENQWTPSALLLRTASPLRTPTSAGRRPRAPRARSNLTGLKRPREFFFGGVRCMIQQRSQDLDDSDWLWHIMKQSTNMASSICQNMRVKPKMHLFWGWLGGENAEGWG